METLTQCQPRTQTCTHARNTLWSLLADIQIRRHWRLFKRQNTTELPPNASVQGPTASAAAPHAPPTPDDYVTRLTARIQAVSKSVADAAVVAVRQTSMCRDGPSSILYDSACRICSSHLGLAMKLHIEQDLLPLMRVHRPSTAKKASQHDRAFLTARNATITKLALAWQGASEQATPPQFGALTHAYMSAPGRSLGEMIAAMFQTRPQDQVRCAALICRTLCLLVYQGLCEALAGTAGPVVPPLPDADDHSPGGFGRARRNNAYTDGGPYPFDSSLARVVYYVSGW